MTLETFYIQKDQTKASQLRSLTERGSPLDSRLKKIISGILSLEDPVEGQETRVIEILDAIHDKLYSATTVSNSSDRDRGNDIGTSGLQPETSGNRMLEVPLSGGPKKPPSAKPKDILWLCLLYLELKTLCKLSLAEQLARGSDINQPPAPSTGPDLHSLQLAYALFYNKQNHHLGTLLSKLLYASLFDPDKIPNIRKDYWNALNTLQGSPWSSEQKIGLGFLFIGSILLILMLTLPAASAINPAAVTAAGIALIAAGVAIAVFASVRSGESLAVQRAFESVDADLMPTFFPEKASKSVESATNRNAPEENPAGNGESESSRASFNVESDPEGKYKSASTSRALTVPRISSLPIPGISFFLNIRKNRQEELIQNSDLTRTSTGGELS